MTNINNYCKKNNLLFIHNPKVMGTSVRKLFNFSGPTNHKFPTSYIDVNLWENSTILVCIRHPITRFISSFKYHVLSNYNGGWKKKFPNLNSMSPEEYFLTFKNIEGVINPQFNYLYHGESDKTADIVYKIEDNNLNDILNSFQIITKDIPIANQSQKDLEVMLSVNLINELQVYYKDDFMTFNYDK